VRAQREMRVFTHRKRKFNETRYSRVSIIPRAQSLCQFCTRVLGVSGVHPVIRTQAVLHTLLSLCLSYWRSVLSCHSSRNLPVRLLTVIGECDNL
jgi:hypothetical protein